MTGTERLGTLYVQRERREAWGPLQNHVSADSAVVAVERGASGFFQYNVLDVVSTVGRLCSARRMGIIDVVRAFFGIVR